LPEDVLRVFLEERVRIAPGEARLLAALSAGSLSRALLLRETEPLQLRDEALSLLGPALRGDAAGLWRATQAFLGYGRAGRERLRRMIEFHALWLRDLLRAGAGAARETLANRDREAEIRRQAQGLSPREIRRRLMVLEEALQSIEGNVAPDLTLFSAMARLGGARLGEGQWPAHPTSRWDY
jgi:DNA polymerase III gamma/tau subunit